MFETLFNFINEIGTNGFMNIFLGIQVFIFILMVAIQSIRILREMRVMKILHTTLSEINRTEGQDAIEIESKIKNGFREIKKSKYKELWERYYSRSSQKDADERIQVEPFFGLDVMHYHMGYRKLMDLGAGLFVSIGVLDGKEKLYFIVETKSSTASEDLRPTELAKIRCGEKHFEAIDTGIVFKRATEHTVVYS